jgi:hypothetical protein
MKNIFLIGALGLLAACQPPAPRDDFSGADTDQQRSANIKPLPRKNAEPGPVAAEYERAIECWALTDVVNTLVSSDVIRDGPVSGFAGRATGSWQDRAATLGGSQGLTRSQVQNRFEERQMVMLAPLGTLPQSEAAERIEEMVRMAGFCSE